MVDTARTFCTGNASGHLVFDDRELNAPRANNRRCTASPSN